MEKRIVYKTDNGIAIVMPAPNLYVKGGHFRNFLKGEVVPKGWEPATIEQIAAKDLPAGVEYKIVNASDIPADRYFREAFTYELGIDMPKARKIHMDCIRAARNVKLEKLDVETMRGKDVQAEKQVLRDLPQTIDLSKATTPDALKQVWPAELGD